MSVVSLEEWKKARVAEIEGRLVEIKAQIEIESDLSSEEILFLLYQRDEGPTDDIKATAFELIDEFIARILAQFGEGGTQ